MIGIKAAFIILLAVLLSGCMFIVKDDQAAKYYGIDKKRGDEYLSQILEKQQQVYQAEKTSAGSKRP